MADSYTDRSEQFISSPAKILLHSGETSADIRSSETEEPKSPVPGDTPASPVRVSTTTWQVKKTADITSSKHVTEVTHHPRSVSTAEIQINEKKHSVDRTENKHTVETETKHINGSMNKKESVDGVEKRHGLDSAENDSCFVARVESVLEEKSVNVSLSTSENSFEEFSISKAADTALDVAGIPISDENKVYSKTNISGQGVFSPSFGVKDSTQVKPVSDDVGRRKDNNETSIQRITYTPGLSIRDFTLQEIKDKKHKSSESKQAVKSDAEAEASFDIGRSLSSLQASSMSWTTANQTEDDMLLSEQDLVQPPMVGELLHMFVCKGDNIEKKFPLPMSPEGELDSPEFYPSQQDKHLEMIDQLSVDDVLGMLDEAAGGVDDVSNEVISLNEAHPVKTEDKALSSLQGTDISVKKNSAVQVSTEFLDRTISLVTSITTEQNVEERSQMEIKTEMTSLTEQTVRLGQSSDSQDEVGRTINLKEVSRHRDISKSEVSTSQTNVVVVVKSEPIEIERKFNITADTEQKLINIGATLLKTKSFTDVYYDNLDYTLTLADCWLRKRKDEWQLKDSVVGNQANSSDITMQCVELTKESDIINTLLQKLKLGVPVTPSSVLDVIKAGELTEFATITTTRKTYKLPNCSIDLDLADNGFMVGEIDVMTTTDKIPSALRTMEDIAQQLGISLLQMPQC
ncbi:uncharacterized protein LOC121389463 [Gigantopelta aegis]|uniref:uncharacterized protein LOC121389463 n=1 Tax=Gigantopelta aegis TaxID=1735272 RepID=UPI001B88B40C|nr:uncharacterized protein LOC121389463 [Gigantopelta aegis]